MTLRVLHVLPAVAPLYGGPSTAIWPMARAVANGGAVVHIATTDANGEDRLSERDLPMERPPTYLFPAERTRGRKLGGLAAWLDRQLPSYDLVVIHSLWNGLINQAARLARKHRVPYLLRPCGMLSVYTWQKSWLKKRLYWWWRQRETVQMAAGFHATSRDEAKEIRSAGATAPLAVIPLGLEPAAFAPHAPGPFVQSVQTALAGRRAILYLSRLHPKKGVAEYLLPAFARMRHDEILLIAGGEDPHAPGYRERIRQSITRHGLEDYVQLLGAVPTAERWALFDLASVFVLPSESENFGQVVVEALARGRPVLVTEGVQCRDIVIQSGAGRVVPRRVPEIAAALRELVATGETSAVDGADRPGDSASAGRRGACYVREHLDWNRIGEQLLQFYQHLVERTRTPGVPA